MSDLSGRKNGWREVYAAVWIEGVKRLLDGPGRVRARCAASSVEGCVSYKERSALHLRGIRPAWGANSPESAC